MNICFRLFTLTLLTLAATNMTFANQEGTPPTDEQKEEQPILTVAESSDFKATSLSAQVIEFVDWCDKKADHVNRFVWGNTIEGRDLIGAMVANPPYNLKQPDPKDERNVVLLLGNIHSGECAGKEALLMMLRELTLNPDHPWLTKNVIYFAPNYNADANDRIGKFNRRGQIGPEEGMGMRANAQGLDLNRDFVKVESDEARSLVRLIDKINPHLFVDCHTTNGSKHQYSLTYDIPHNPATAAPIRDFLRQKMMPSVTKSLEEKGTLTFYYGNFNRDHTKWTTYGYEPRYSTEYVGLRGRLAVLSEAYSYISYKDRIIATKDFVAQLLDYMTDNHETVRRLLDEVDRELITTAEKQPERIAVSLSAKVKAFEEKFTLKGYKDDQPHDYECEFVSDYESITSTPLPYAYVIPNERARCVDRLLMHGIKVEKLDNDLKTKIQFDTFTEVDRAERAFQKHKMVRAQSERDEEERNLPAGSYVVRTNQPLSRLACYMLESASDDGFVTWNFLDDVVNQGSQHPIVRIAAPVEMKTTVVTKVEKLGKLDINLIDGPNSLLANLPKPPKWHGDTNQIKGQLWGRDFLIDVETGAFTGLLEPPFEQSTVKKALIAANCDEELASELVTTDPVLSLDKKSAIYSSSDYAYLFHQEFGAIQLGDPDNPSEMFTYNSKLDALAYVQSNVLRVLPLTKSTFDAAKPVTPLAAETKDMFIGKFDWVYQEELYGRGNFKGFWFNASGDRIAFLELDESPVLPYTVLDNIPVRGRSEITNYPKAGDPLPTVKVCVSDLTGSKVTKVDLSNYKGEFLVSRVTWSKATNQLLLQIQNREQTWLDVVATDADGKNPKLLFRDQTPAWIESPGDPVVLKNGNFLWLSPRSGHKHLYMYPPDGSQAKKLTQGDWEIRELLGVGPEEKYAYYTAAKESATDLDAYRLNLHNGETTRITKSPGTHSVTMSDDFSYFIDNVSTATKPTQSYICRNDGVVLRRVDATNDDRMNYLNLAEPRFLEVPTDDQPMDAMMIVPPDFDEGKKYPVLVHVYGGPQTPRVRNRFAGEFYLWHQMLAQQGYIIWLCDGRSSSYRSAKAVWPIHKNLAEYELADVEAGVAWLKKQSFIDGDRIGLWGWSYGGYMTAYAMTRSETFKVGISGAPVTDWANYDAIYTERYMDTPQNNPEGYKRTSVLPVAKDLQGKLLLIHGTIDDNVHISNTMQFVYELQKAGKQFELMVYPKSRHSVRDEQQQAHLRKLMMDFILKNL